MRSPSTKRWPALDGLRAVAVLLVIGFHSDGFIPNGYLGVDIFFVLSGFLITTLLRQEIEQDTKVDRLAFYRRRFVRLYPALSVLCVLVSVAAVLAHVHVRSVGLGAIMTLGYVANIWEYTAGHDTHLLQHTWTLALEEQFYLIWPLLLPAVVRWRRAAWVLSITWVGIEVLDLALGQPPALSTYVRAAGLPLGCALAFALGHRRLAHGLRRLAGPAFLGLLVLAVAPAHLERELAGWPVGLAAVLTLPVVAGLVGESRLIRPLSSPMADWIGRRSYGLYLWHFPFLVLAIDQGPKAVPLPLRALIGVGVAFIISAVSYRWVETPLQRRYRPARGDSRHRAVKPRLAGAVAQ